MIQDDLWADPADEFGDVELSSELIKQKADISVSSATTTRYSRTALRKVVLKKVAESEVSDPYLFVGPDQSHFYSASSGFGPSILPKTPDVLFEDVWNSNSGQSTITEPLSIMTNPTRLRQHISAPDIGFDRLPPTEEANRTGLEFEDDLWAASEDDDKETLGEELLNEWDEGNAFSPQEEKNDTAISFASDFAAPPDIFAVSDKTPILQEFEDALESDYLLNSFQLIDIKAELELVEEELAAQELEGKSSAGVAKRRGMVQAPGWMGSSSVLHINWENEEKAEQEALERLGYAKLEISEATRAFVIQAARAYHLTVHEEQLLTTRLVEARSHLERLPDDEYYETKRNELRAEIADIERTLVHNLQWAAVKKAPQFLGQGIELDDLIQYGMLGIFAGIRHFDINRKTRLLLIVNLWVYQVLARAVMDYGRLIRLPAYIHESLANVKKHRAELEMVLGRPPTDEELASAIQMPVKRLKELLSLPTTISLDYYFRAEHANDGYSFQSMEEALVVSEDVINDETSKFDIKLLVVAMLQCLTIRERRVIELRFGLDDDGDGCTLDEVGRVLCVTRERVRQIEERALKKIRRSCWKWH